MNKRMSWIGLFEGTSAYATINRHLTAALERAGWTVLRGVHNVGLDLTPLCVVHTYPLTRPNVVHLRNVGLAVWEFTGALGVPRSFRAAFEGFDIVGAPSEWVCEQFRAVTPTQVVRVQWGIDPAEFAPGPGQLQVLPQVAQEAAIRLLWVGGTDARHGFDVALKVMDALPDGFHLIAKQSAHYPAAHADHPRVTILREDLPSLAPLYRTCDALLHSARGVGFSLPVLEALACGLPVASTDLPPVREFAPVGRVVFAGGSWQGMGTHHVHRDCLPVWLEPDVEALALAVQRAVALGHGVSEDWRQQWTWDAAARRLEEVLTVSEVRV